MTGLFSQYHPLQCTQLDHRCGEIRSNLCSAQSSCSSHHGLCQGQKGISGSQERHVQRDRVLPYPKGHPGFHSPPPHIPVFMQQPEGCLKHKPDPRHSRSWPVGLPPPWKAIPMQPHPWPVSLAAPSWSSSHPWAPVGTATLTSSCNSFIKAL